MILLLFLMWPNRNAVNFINKIAFVNIYLTTKVNRNVIEKEAFCEKHTHANSRDNEEHIKMAYLVILNSVGLKGSTFFISYQHSMYICDMWNITIIRMYATLYNSNHITTHFRIGLRFRYAYPQPLQWSWIWSVHCHHC